MYRSRMFLMVIVLAAAMGCSVYSAPFPWGPDFEKEGKLTGVIVCDAGRVRMKSYDDPHMTDSYRGLTISFDDDVRYYLFRATPSATEISLFKNVAHRKFVRISSEKLTALLQKEAPNLFALAANKDNDCRKE